MCSFDAFVFNVHFFLMNCHFWQQLPKFIKTNQWKACSCSYPHVFKFFYLFSTAAIIQIYKNWINEKSACVQMLCLCSILFLELSFLTAIIIIQIYKNKQTNEKSVCIHKPMCSKWIVIFDSSYMYNYPMCSKWIVIFDSNYMYNYPDL